VQLLGAWRLRIRRRSSARRRSPSRACSSSTAKTAKGYCENYIHWKVQQDIGHNKPGFSIVVPK
jgi:hypothetical protein